MNDTSITDTRTVYVIHAQNRTDREFFWYPATANWDTLMTHYGNMLTKYWAKPGVPYTTVRLTRISVPANLLGARVTRYLDANCRWAMSIGTAMLESNLHDDHPHQITAV